MPVPFRNLNTRQKEVVKHKRRTLLVLAGPGTGKTEVLTHRVAHLLRVGVNPKEILAVTFSRKAAGEMAERLNEFGLEEIPRTSTLHSESLRILGETGKTSKFLVADDESRLLLRDALEDLSLGASAKELKRWEQLLKLQKADGRIPSEIIIRDKTTRILRAVYDRYEQILAFNGAIDLDGLVLKVVRALSDSSNIYLPQERHILVDEYQDINRAEHRLVQILAQTAKSLFVVGDDDQSIYGWRGADPGIIRKFENEFEGAQVEILEESMRCPEHILQAALGVVSKDPAHRHNPLCSGKGPGNRVYLLDSSSETAEAWWIANWISRNVLADSTELRCIAVLCKRLDLAEDIVAYLKRRGISVTYWRSGGLFANENVREILWYARVLADRSDNLALRRCVMVRRGTGIGTVGMSELRRLAEREGLPLWDVLAKAKEYQQLGRWRSAFERFAAIIDHLRTKSTKLKPDEIIDLVAKSLGTSKLSGVAKLKNFAASLPANSTIEDFISEVNKNRGLDLAEGGPEPEDTSDAVAVMSMHSAKGLTYDIVFLLGMDESILPDPTQDENEQRRLCYVAMTRAKKELFLCHAKRRKGPAVGGFSFLNPSPFVADIPREHMEVISNR